MSLEFIPNQPIIFEKPIGDYPCLNNDPKHYGQLAQEDDTLCVQWKLGPCGESPLCEPDMKMETPGSNELGTWTAGTGWSSSSFANLSFDGASGDGIADQNITGLVAGATYQLRFDITTFTGIFDLEVTWSLADVRTITTAGNYLLYFTANNDPLDLSFITSGATTTGDTLVIENIQLIQWTDCWQDELPDDIPTWSYSYDAGQGKFCSLDTTQGDLINTTAFATTGNYHGVVLVISNATQGALEVRLGGVLLGTTSGNGEQGFYGIPTAGTDLVLTKINDFDGCVSQVNIEDYGDPSNATVRFISDDGMTYSNYEIPDLIEDRLIWCSQEYGELTWTVDGTPDSQLECALLRVEVADPCDGTLYLSTNFINFNRTGWDCTKLVESWNDGYAFGFYFGDINNPDFKLTQRLRVLAFNPVYRNAGEEYLYSSGNSGRSFAQSQKARTAWFDYMDEYAHDCTRTQLLGQKLFIDGYAFYYPTEDYEPEWNENGKYNLAQSRVTVFHEEAIFGSACGVMANTVCPPQIVQQPYTYTQLSIKVNNLDITFLTEIDELGTALFIYDSSGNVVDASIGTIYDFTDATDRAAWLSAVQTFIDTNYSTTSTGSISYSAGILNIDITALITGTVPINTMSISICESPTSFAFIPQSFSISVIYS